MRLAIVAVVLLGALAYASAEVSFPKPISGRLTCILPITRLTCTRDWRSGFVAGMRYGYKGIDNTTQVCSTGIVNQTTFEMSTPAQINTANNGAPAWYKDDNPMVYLYPDGSPITQVIVLEAPNPWGDKFGNIPAIIFGFQTNYGLDFAVCGNAKYAMFYLYPDRFPAPPTPVTLKSVFTSPLSEGEELTALGSFDGKCGTRGTSFSAYLGGDPWKSSKFRLKSFLRPCFTEWDNEIQTWKFTQLPPKRVWGHFHCDDEDDKHCIQPCHYDKKHGKKSTSFSCTQSGTAIATGKYSAIQFDKEGNKWEYERDDKGQYSRAMFSGDLSSLPEGDLSPEV